MSWYHRRTYLVTVGGSTAPLPSFLGLWSLVLSLKMTSKKMRTEKDGFTRLHAHHNNSIWQFLPRNTIGRGVLCAKQSKAIVSAKISETHLSLPIIGLGWQLYLVARIFCGSWAQCARAPHIFYNTLLTSTNKDFLTRRKTTRWGR